MEARCVVVFLAFSLCSIIGTIDFCDPTLELQKCLNILGVNLNEISGLSISWNRTKLKHVCGSVVKFWTCYDNSVKRCDDMELGKDLNRLNSTLNYMCKEGHESYLKTRVCMSHVNVSRKLQQCVSHNYELRRTDDENCNKIKDLKNCARNAVSSCGEDAKKYIDGFMKEVPYGLIDCDGLSHGTLLAAISTVPLAIIIAAYLIVVVTCALVKKKSDVPFEKMERKCYGMAINFSTELHKKLRQLSKAPD